LARRLIGDGVFFRSQLFLNGCFFLFAFSLRSDCLFLRKPRGFVLCLLLGLFFGFSFR
jgi:hypothetical protein